MTGIYLDGGTEITGECGGSVREDRRKGIKKKKIRTMLSYPGENTNHHRDVYSSDVC